MMLSFWSYVSIGLSLWIGYLVIDNLAVCRRRWKAGNFKSAFMSGAVKTVIGVALIAWSLHGVWADFRANEKVAEAGMIRPVELGQRQGFGEGTVAYTDEETGNLCIASASEGLRAVCLKVEDSDEEGEE